ncbi:hypothetical protein F511_36416 [Dorcoceras hygrometricum]|uniref:Uncharacterized protein n=1 Tax=Dorcoceras hygrometricum TaxID=472368 RepID=A0A2Z7BAC3_9LAMI|nr:hypothetical protein F511_36416 [Dorcoceras hygrometricum]
MLISSGLLVQPDEGVSDLVVDRIGDNLPQSTEKSRIIVITVGARHKCQRVGTDFVNHVSRALRTTITRNNTSAQRQKIDTGPSDQLSASETAWAISARYTIQLRHQISSHYSNQHTLLNSAVLLDQLSLHQNSSARTRSAHNPISLKQLDQMLIGIGPVVIRCSWSSHWNWLSVDFSNSSDESESGSVGLLLLRRFVSYPFRRQRRSCKRITETSPFSSFPGFTAGRGFDPAGGAPGGG